jgi:NTE family protein
MTGDNGTRPPASDRPAPWLDHVWTQLRRREVFPIGYLSSRASVFADRGCAG